jgi:hypothetical protein
MGEVRVRLTPRRVPVSVYTTDGVLPTFAAVTLCGASWPGMTNTADLEIVMRRALDHAESCARCAQRWEQLNEPGTIVTVYPIG